MGLGLLEKHKYRSVGSANENLTAKQIIKNAFLPKIVKENNKSLKNKASEYHCFRYFFPDIDSWPNCSFHDLAF